MASITSPSKLMLVLLSLHGKCVLGQEEQNVYGKPMTACGPSHGAGCTYAAGDGGAHQVCVKQLPHGFSSDTGQGPWSDQYTGEPWCICIWAYSNYILQNKDLHLRCESIPDKVLEEQYSLDKFKDCGQMSSTDGCGPEDIRRSIQSLCQQCDVQTQDPASKTALKAKCDTILASAPKAPMQRLYDESSTGKAALRTQTTQVMPSALRGILFGCMLIIAGLLVCNVVAIARTNRNKPNTLLHDDPLQGVE